VIDDHVETAHAILLLLELEGYEARVAYDADGGLKCARAFMPDIVLCDIELPGIDGFQLAELLRADPELGRTPLVALTGRAEQEDVAKTIAAGFDAHFSKPVIVDELLSALANLVTSHRGS
jgi:CheY-like chemotaxis protein